MAILCICLFAVGSAIGYFVVPFIMARQKKIAKRSLDEITKGLDKLGLD